MTSGATSGATAGAIAGAGRVLLRGGRLFTGTVDRANDRVDSAMFVVDGTITWIGSDDGAETYVDQSDEVIDLDASLVTPAFVDAHVHTTTTGLALTGLDLSDTTSLAQMLDRLEAFCRSQRGHHVLGHGWDETRWPEGRPPTRLEVDRASYGGVVYLTRVDVHSAVASSALLAALPEVKALDGYDDSGVLRREAHHAARAAALDTITAGQREAAVRATFTRAAQLGIGALHELGGPDISGAEDFSSVLALAETGPYPEVIGYWGQLDGVASARALGARGAAGDLFADGALGSHTACLRRDYVDQPHAGAGYLRADEVRDHVISCTNADLQAGFHVIGDGALDAVAAGFRQAADALGANTVRRARHRLEHVEMIDTNHMDLFAQLGVVASVQPGFDALWGGPDGMYVNRLGAERAASMNPFATMRARGMALAFGSDAPVTPLDPWGGVRAAVLHHRSDQRLDTATAFAAHTVGGWSAARIDEQGWLAPGLAATYAVWSPPERGGSLAATGLPDLAEGAPTPQCRRTVVRGQTIFAFEGC